MSFPYSLIVRLLVTLVVLLLVQLSCSGPGTVSPPDQPSIAPTVLLVSIDGFHPSYLDQFEAPTLSALANAGVRSKGLIPVFPTKTFPNHYSIVTGLYPAQHGIVANTMYDPEFDARFSLGNRDAVTDARWWDGEPIWVTAERQGQRAGTYFWPGSEAPIGGIRPSYWKVYDGSVPGEARVDQVLGWLDLQAEERPTFLTLYFSEVDNAGHDFGPDALETGEAVANVDRHMARLVRGLRERGLLSQIQLLIVSDHGMTPLYADRTIPIHDYIDMDDVQVVDRSPILALRPKPSKADAIFEQLDGAHPQLKVYRKGTLPERLHYDGHRRIHDLIGIAEEGWTITTRPSTNGWAPSGGTHGYDNALPSMHALFIGHGPAFTQGAVIEPFENIHLYSLMTHLLNLTPAPNVGDFKQIDGLLR
ncbi:MAG: ectonucleotide pyrophosphatase/phosphodiesterase [Rhodothermales bacterium]